ncbi:hypothetical protein HPB50_011967 [Hyalomma asiaticum]|uniref:Uncharacterized protein n=1 Tax=Hyalomma asiaticum TaxID=266040 RepID=A0ACB7STH3_HYAAI|nr:hypothetical protein HPB50_011967 [Hyalomma asiaticum]
MDALVMGPANAPYEGGHSHFIIQCPPEYPFNQPRVRLINTDGGLVRFSPNLHEIGMVTLGTLGIVQAGLWSPLLCHENVLASIKLLLSKKPYFNQPGVYSETWVVSRSATTAPYSTRLYEWLCAML